MDEEVDQFLVSVGSDAVGDEDDPFLGAEGVLALEDDAIEEEVEVLVFQGAFMEGSDVRVEGFGEFTDEGGADGMAQEGLDDLPDPSGGDAGEEEALERFVDGRLVGGEGLEDLFRDGVLPCSRDSQFLDDSQVRIPGAGVEAIAGVGSLFWGFMVPGNLHRFFPYLQHRLFHQDFDQLQELRFHVSPKIFFHFTPPADTMSFKVPLFHHGRVPPWLLVATAGEDTPCAFQNQAQLTQSRVHHRTF